MKMAPGCLGFAFAFCMVPLAGASIPTGNGPLLWLPYTTSYEQAAAPGTVDADPFISLLTPSLLLAAANGDVDLSGEVNAADVLLAHQVLSRRRTLSAEEQAHADIAPLVNGVPVPDSIVDSGDLLLIMRIASGELSLPVCGNGSLEAGEQCDNGNVVPGDGCDANCVIETALPGFRVLASSKDEGETLNMVVRLSAALPTAVSVDYTTVDAGAIGGEDYVPVSGTLVFGAGTVSRTVAVQTIEDALYETNEQFKLSLSNPSAGTRIDVATGTGTIRNDEQPPLIFVAGSSASEGSSIAVTVTRSGDAQAPQSIDLATVITGDDTASPNDFIGLSGTVTFNKGEAVKSLSVATNQDAVYESNESFTLVPSNPTAGAVLGTESAQGIITNDEPPPSFSVSGGTAVEGSPITFVISRSGDAEFVESVEYATGIEAGDTASPTDFVERDGTLSFSQGQTSKLLVVNTVQDALAESGETFTLRLSNPTGGAAIATATAKGTILDPGTAGGFVERLQLPALDGSAGVKLNGIRGNAAFGFRDQTGASVAGVGDINGDGRPDIMVGAAMAEHYSQGDGWNQGLAYVFFGDTASALAAKTSGATGYDLGRINRADAPLTADGIMLIGQYQSSRLGAAAAGSVGDDFGGSDFDGDGRADLLVAESSVFPNNAFALYGNATAAGFSLLHELVVSELAGQSDRNGDGLDDGARFGGLPAGGLGISIAAAGDMNGDGIDDLVIGVPGMAANGSNSGEVFLVLGGARSQLDALDDLAQNHAGVIRFVGPAANAYLGRSVAGIGDINGDGYADLAVGATGDETDGRAYVIFGAATAALNQLSGTVAASGIGSALNGSNGFVLDNHPFNGFGFKNRVGIAVSGLGDVNGDGLDDFAVVSASFGMAYVIHGATQYGAMLDLTAVAQSQTGGYAFMGDISAVSTVGDLNGDGRNDLLLGAASQSRAFLFYGPSNPGSLTSTPSLLDGAPIILRVIDLTMGGGQLLEGGTLYGRGAVLEGTAGSSTGASVAGVGDIDGDGINDLLIGAPDANSPTATTSTPNAGQAYIVYGHGFSAPPSGN